MRRTSLLPIIILLCTLSLLSAFLLFQVQPVISKFILPWFGGSPGVWTTCMLFFQVVLFAGYAYAHLLTRLPMKAQTFIHGILVVAALACLPISPADSWKPTGSEEPSVRILLLLLGTVGLPYFVLSSTSPLTQVWFARAVPGGNPWRLYALSNLGSLGALLSYPFFVEVKWDVGQQTMIWSVGFVIFAGITLSIALMDRNRVKQELPLEEMPLALPDEKPRWWQRLLWVLLPACASVMLLGATNHVCQDVAVIPFMWVVPLSLYLLTFIICFEHERWYLPVAWSVAAVLVISFVLAAEAKNTAELWTKLTLPAGLADWLGKWPSKEFPKGFVAQIIMSFSAMFLACMVCHGELARLKPQASRLTEFYLLMSAGGALGGLAVSLGAPQLFVTYLEWPLGLLMCFCIAVAACACSVMRMRWRMVGLPIGIVFLLVGGAVVYLVQGWRLKVEPMLVRERNFYGAIYVQEENGEGKDLFHTLVHGGITHGMQDLENRYRQWPTTYYGRDTGIGRALDSLKSRQNARVGLVGMGAGTVACYAKAGDVYRFYEINPVIPQVTRTHFTFLTDAEERGAKVETILGDARLSLEREPPQDFDVLLLDAFSGDAIPIHLLTQEAFAIYQRHMKPDGIIAVHTTNSYLALGPVVERQALELGWRTTRMTTNPDGVDYATDYVLVTKNEAFLNANPPDVSAEDTEFDDLKVPLWTDRYHNLYQIFKGRKEFEESITRTRYRILRALNVSP